MISGLNTATRINMIDSRIHILKTRGETMNQGIIGKLMREKRKLLGIKVSSMVSPSNKIDD